MKKFSKVSRLSKFDKDIRRLLKRFRTLEGDLRICIETQIVLYHKKNIDNKGIFPITGLQIEEPKIFKTKKFACRSLKGKGGQSGIRVIYAYFEEEDKIELIEIYYKEDKENEDRRRILKHYKKQKDQ